MKTTSFAALSLPEWTEYMRELIQREGRAVRAATGNNTIEAKSLTENDWFSLPLPNGEPHFATTAERDQALTRIQTP
ncbi:MAG: hypothetical protein K0R17_3613 [Rariglobus sp.]|jgi:hypothetical protein|nr:hypothetical protein [Rariglobus sp.]